MRKKQIIILLVFFIFGLASYLLRESVVIKSVTSFFQSTFSDARSAIFNLKVDEESKLLLENRKLSEKLSELNIMKRENDALKSQFEEKTTSSYKLVPARILGYKGRGVYETFIIDVGENNNVSSGMAVVVGNTLVGNIYKTSQSISEVRTILHPEFSTIVKYPPTNARGIIRGFNSFIIMDNVLITDTLEKDGIVVTIGELNNVGIGIPSNLNVGKIDSIDREETASFQAAQVEPLIDYSQISNVFVIVAF